MANNSQFLVSMKFMGIDEVSPVMKKQIDEAKKLKQQVDSLGKGPSGGFKFLDSLNKGLKTASDHLGNMKKKMDEIKASGFGNILAGGAMVAPVLSALNAAGKFQQGMVTISGATGATPADLADLKKTIREASNVTKFSTQEVQDMAIKQATSGMSIEQVKQLTPIMAKFAEVQQFGKGTSPDTAVTDAISSAHMLGIYDPKNLDAFLNNFNKATFMTPGSTGEFFDTFKYMAPTAKGLGLKDNDILYTAALANRVGFLGSMGGTESADMLLRSIPGIFGGQSHVGKDGKIKMGQQLRAMVDMGLAKTDGSSVFYDSKGNFKGIENFITELSNATKGMSPEKMTMDFKQMFGMQGMKLADILSARGGEQLQVIKQQMDSMKSITLLQDEFNKTYEGQLAQFKTNLSNLNQDVGTILLPTATHLLQVMQPYVTNAATWMSTHTGEIKTIAEVTAGMGALLIAVGGAKIVFGTLAGPIIGTFKKAVDGVLFTVESLKKQAALSRGLPEQMIRASVVNVYGSTVNGGGGGAMGIDPTVLEEGGLPPRSSRGSTTRRWYTPDVSGWGSRAWGSTKSLSKGLISRGGAILPISLAFGAYDVMSAPEGHKVETAVKASGGIIGGWAGAEAGMAMGAALGSVVPGIGTAIGAAFGGIAGGVAGAHFASIFSEKAAKAIQDKLQADDMAKAYEDYKNQPKHVSSVPGALDPFGTYANLDTVLNQGQAMLSQKQLDYSEKFNAPYGAFDTSKYEARQFRNATVNNQKSYNDNSTNNITVITNDPEDVARKIPPSMNILKRDWAMANTH